MMKRESLRRDLHPITLSVKRLFILKKKNYFNCALNSILKEQQSVSLMRDVNPLNLC